MAARTPRTRQHARPRARADWRPTFLEALAQSGMVSAAADAAGIGRRTAYDHRERDRDFAREWDDVIEETTDQLEREAYRRAVEGTDKPVFQGGEQVGAIREYSDHLLMFLLRARKPKVYVERYQVQHAAPPERPPVLDIFDPDIRAKSRELLRAVGRARERQQIPPEKPVRLDLKSLDDQELHELDEAASGAGEIVQ